MREQMRNQDRTMANIESHPEGFNALRRMYENFQEPLMDAATGQGANQQDPLAALLGSAAAANQSAGLLLPWHFASLFCLGILPESVFSNRAFKQCYSLHPMLAVGLGSHVARQPGVARSVVHC